MLVKSAHTCEISRDIFGSPIDFQCAPGNAQGNLTGMSTNPQNHNKGLIHNKQSSTDISIGLVQGCSNSSALAL